MNYHDALMRVARLLAITLGAFIKAPGERGGVGAPSPGSRHLPCDGETSEPVSGEWIVCSSAHPEPLECNKLCGA